MVRVRYSPVGLVIHLSHRMLYGFPLPDKPDKQLRSNVLTEATVERMFREIISTTDNTEEKFEQAEELLETELRDESPLRHRLTVELDELRTIAAK